MQCTVGGAWGQVQAELEKTGTPCSVRGEPVSIVRAETWMG